MRQKHVELDADTLRRLQTLAKHLSANEPALNRVDMFGPKVHSGMGEGPALFFEDHSEVALFEQTGDVPLAYRSFLLGGENDVFLLAGRRFPEFEAYCRSALGLGATTVLEPAAAPGATVVPLSLRCAADPTLLTRLCDAARLEGTFTLVPYMGTGNAWRLASAIASQSGVEVFVAAPPPRLTRRVNDKLWFLERIRETLDINASPLTYSVFGPAALAARLRALASRCPRVAVKVPDSAGSLGNVMIRSDAIAGKSLTQIRQMVFDILTERGWQSSYPLMVGVWDHPVVASPSVNVWIPDRQEGPPIIEGLFSQALSGDEAEFIGAEPSDLPKPLEDRILFGAACLAQYFQNLGYFGRCGFDTILVGASVEEASIHWIECNGRWGGVSLPITVANRLIGDWARKSIVIIQQIHLAMPPRPFPAILDLLKEHLFSLPDRPEGVVLLAPGRLVDGSGLNLMVIADTKDAARARLEAVMNLLAA